MNTNMHEKMPFYYQRTGPYADLPYHRHTIRTDGCGIVAFAMAASYLLDRNVEPPELVHWAGRRFAGLRGRGTRGVFFVKASEAYGLSCRPTNDLSEALHALRCGSPVIYYTKKSGGIFSDIPHYLVLSGITEEGRVLIHNPNGMNDGKDFPVETIGKFTARSITGKSFYIIEKGNVGR
ncbi:MAG: C39 family peptidase [Lachnospiraceae bacterium]|nr:C39 family peptidase [Lachnospiraceae bacterium]